MGAALNIGSVFLPIRSLFTAEIRVVEQKIADTGSPTTRRNSSTAQARKHAVRHLIEGLYQAWCTIGPIKSLALPTSPGAYHKKRHGAIRHLRYSSVIAAISALEAMGWVDRHRGYLGGNGEHVLTTLTASGDLLARFAQIGLRWQALLPPLDGIVLRDKHWKTDERISLPVPGTRAVLTMRRNLKVINEFISEQAICLHLSNHNLARLGQQLASNGQPLRFSSVMLRRVFSRGSMDCGGRFYGGWWESIPSEFRPYITINGLATGELDFSNLHPRLMYVLHGQTVPAGDLYDDGWRDPSSPIYEPAQEPYRSRRKIIKTVFNATHNDASGRFRLDPQDHALAKSLGLSAASIRSTLFKRHPLLESIYKTDFGIRLQYIDSQIAETVMLNLIAQGICCLPIHDSFIVPRHQAGNLVQSMRDAYLRHTGDAPALKQLEPFATDFRLRFNEAGDIDLASIHLEHEAAIHNIYCATRRQAMTGSR
jgi:hypothetical protein